MWEKEMAIARQAAREAGEVLTGRFERPIRITKKGEIDLVTEADLESEKAILRVIGGHFPSDSVLTEESGEHRHLPERVWIVDPLDGTTNFAHKFPFFAVSIALEVEGEVVLGIVLCPHMKECFEAIKGQGAFLNREPIRVSGTDSMGDALLATGFPYTIRQSPEQVLERFGKMIVLAQGVRRPGAASIDLCHVAAGRFDGFWEEDLKPWDTAAGSLIVLEAGGRLSTFEGDPYTPYLKSIVASNPLIHRAMVGALSGRSTP